MNIYILEIKRFFKENRIFLISTSLIFGIFLAGAITFLNQSDEVVEPETEIEDSQEVFDHESKTAFFRFYIENPDGYAFNNSVTLDQLFNLDLLYEEVLNETNIDIKKIKETALEKEILDFSPVRVKIDYDSYILVAVFETGNDESNLVLANFYYDYLFNKGFNILENHKIYSLVEPQLVEAIEEKEDVKVVQTKKTLFDWIKNIGVNLIVGLVLAAVFSIGLMLLKELFGKKLNYFFGYDGESFDDYIVYDRQLANEQSVQYFIGLDSSIKKLILMESEINKSDEKILFNNSNVQFDLNRSIVNTEISNKYDEIILIVESKNTTRKWYNNQKTLIELHDAKTKLVQLNHDDDTLNQRGS